MGLFHCPIGAEYYSGEGCINCGLCKATNAEEKFRATGIIREYIREHGLERNPELKIRRIAVCGKGGCGKSTVSALFASALEYYGYRTLVLDTDSSNAGLWRKIGAEKSPEVLMVLTDEEPEEIEALSDPDFFKRDPLYFDDIGDRFVEWNRLKGVMIAGKITDPLIACACSIDARARRLMSNLTPRNKEIVLVDVEAGLESFGRGFEQYVDTILIPVEPSAEAIELAERIQYMAEGLGIRRVRAIINKCEDEDTEEFIKEALSEKGIRYLGAIPKSKDVQKMNLMGLEATEELAMPIAGDLVRWMLDEAEMPHEKVKTIN